MTIRSYAILLIRMIDSEFGIGANNRSERLPGEYFGTHDVVGKTVTRTLDIDLANHGYTRENRPSLFQVKEVTVPVYDETGLYVIQILRHDLPPREPTTNKPHYSLLFLGGGSSDARGNVDWIARMEDALATVQDKIPFNVDRIIGVSHVAGSPRTKGGKDAAKQSTLTTAAKVIKQAIEDPEVKISQDGIILAGFSLGGTQAIELAALYGEKCPYLLLADTAGMASHPKLAYEFSLGTLFSAIDKYKKQGNNFFNALKSALWELRVSWGGRKGVPTLVEMAKDMVTSNDDLKHLAKAYGFEHEEANTAANVTSAMTDSTIEARKKVSGNVIFSPVAFAKVVNVIIARLNDKYPSVNELETVGEETIRSDISLMLRELFPHAQSVSYSHFPGQTHSSVRTDQEFLINMFSTLQQTTAGAMQSIST